MNAIKDLIDALNNDSVVALLHVVHDAIDGTANLRAGVISQYNFFPGPVAGETRKARRNVRGIVVTWDSRTRARACWKVWTHLDGWSHTHSQYDPRIRGDEWRYSSIDERTMTHDKWVSVNTIVDALRPREGE